MWSNTTSITHARRSEKLPDEIAEIDINSLIVYPCYTFMQLGHVYIRFRDHLRRTCRADQKTSDDDDLLFCKSQCGFDKVNTCGVLCAFFHIKPPLQVICFSHFCSHTEQNGYRNNVFFTRIKAFSAFLFFLHTGASLLLDQDGY